MKPNERRLKLGEPTFIEPNIGVQCPLVAAVERKGVYEASVLERHAQ